jgi:hypothetical protein
MNQNLGSEWTALECDALALRYIPIKLLEEEAELNDTKFWDYRFMHPSQATQHYAECYAQALKRAVSRRTDIWKGLNMKGLKKPIVFELEARAITGFWKGRQMADRIGCPYDFYCEHAMLFADKARMHFLPSSSQMYTRTVPERLQGLPSLVEYVVERWVARIAHSSFYATHPAYLADNYTGGQEQIQYLNYLFNKIKGSNLPEGVLCTIMEKNQISREQVLFAFPKSGDDLLRRAAILSA